MYPVTLNISKKLCLVVGGGAVALRKVLSLIDAGATVRVVSPHVTEEIQELADSRDIEIHLRGYEVGDAIGAFCVFASTDDSATQNLVVADARNCGALVNSASNPEVCDFQVPAQIKRGDFLLTVSTGGGSPAFSRVVRQKLEDEYGVEYGNMSALMAVVRREVLTLGADSRTNRDVFRNIVAAQTLDVIKKSQWQELRDILGAYLPREIDVEKLVEEFVAGRDA